MDNEKYDVIICGTGITESILSGLLSIEGYKILHIDRNDYYGDESASLNLSTLWKKFKPEGQKPPPVLGTNREWNVDLVPKFVLASGKLVKMLLKTQVSVYLHWKCISGTYVYQWKKGGMFSSAHGTICKVPATEKEALTSDLMGMFEKRRAAKFMSYANGWEETDKKTWGKHDVSQITMAQMMKTFDLEDNTIDFIGHAVALYTDDSFLNKPAIESMRKIKVYLDSFGRFGNSPFIYPIYGLAGIPEGFSRKCAVHGGVYMLNQSFTKVLYNEDGTVAGIRDGEEGDEKAKIAYAKTVICHPRYMLDVGMNEKVKQGAKVIRAICIINKPINKTDETKSCQIIIPQRQTGRKSDIFVMLVSDIHQVCKKGFWVAVVSALVETNDPKKELQHAWDIIGQPCEQFVTISDLYGPSERGTPKDNIFVTETLDSTSHFESAAEDVLRIYKLITGKELDLENLPEDPEDC